MTWRRGIEIKNPAELERMRAAGRVNAEALLAAVAVVRPGATTAEIDQAALRSCVAMVQDRLWPSGPTPYPAVMTVSVNEELVHGSWRRRLKSGRHRQHRLRAIVDGFVGDSAVTVPVGEIAAEAWSLLEATLAGLWAGVGEMQTGRRTGDVSSAIQSAVEGRGFSVTKDYTGHGVGRAMHEDPQVPNYGVAGKGPLLRPGMTIALEPMVLAGGSETRVLDDGWTVVSRDRRLTAHFEHSVAVTSGGPVILTAIEDPHLDGPRASWYNNFFAGRPNLAEAHGVMAS
jgi:methionyl aminopeptidase